jgi:putative transposase
MISLQERRQLVDDSHPSLSKSAQCELLSLHRSGIYYSPIPEKQENLAIMKEIDKAYLETPFYGMKRLMVHLSILGYHLNIKRLRRLSKIVGWKTLFPTRKTTKSDPEKYKYPYLLKGLDINRNNQVWEIDITYIPMRHGFMYLFAIIDVHSRYVIHWDVSNSMTAKWCCSVIEQAIEEHACPEIINSDQGAQFTGELYVELLKEKTIKISMDSKGRAIDNIYIERLWRSVKSEHVYLFAYETGGELRKGLSWYFEFYNMRRPHQSLSYQTPSSVFNNTEVRSVA